MRLPAVLGAFLAWVSCCAGCGPKLPPGTPERNMATQLKAETVALVKTRSDGRVKPFCTGVWVSPTAILTAGHCVAHAGESEDRAEADRVAEEFELTPAGAAWDPVGHAIQYKTQDA